MNEALLRNTSVEITYLFSLTINSHVDVLYICMQPPLFNNISFNLQSVDLTY